jgi:hypothetical protein
MMYSPICLQPLTADERLRLKADRRTADAFRVRRAPLASRYRRSSKSMAEIIEGSVPIVRLVIPALAE